MSLSRRSSKNKRPYFPSFSLIILSFFFLYCAKISPPPGGPIDKTGPSIISTTPEGDSINIPKDNVISIQFSENINKKTVEGAIFISPRFSEELKFKWKSKSLNIVLPDSFTENTTYIVNIGSSISDLRGNKMDNSYIFAFSTGDVINQGKISGTVFRDGEPYPNASVGLFEFQTPNSIMQFDSTYPPYLTQSGKSGEYGLEYILDGKFFVIAFDDKNKNQLFNYPKEAFGLPDRIAEVSIGHSEPVIDFYLFKEDTTLVEILSTTITSDRLIKVRFSEKIFSDSLINNPEKIYLTPSDNNHLTLHPSAFKEQKGVTSSSFNLFFNSLKEGKYVLRFDYKIFGRHHDSIATIESSEFDVIFDSDNKSPEIVSVSHSKREIFPSDSVIEILFSEPIDDRTAKDALSLFDAESSKYDIQFSQPDHFKLNLDIDGLTWNRNYTLNVIESLIVDLSGNSLGDSVTQFIFSTYDQDSLGSMSGKIVIDSNLDSTVIPYISFNSQDKIFSLEKKIADGRFDIPLPPGEYLLSGFLDENGNGIQDYGSLFPFHYAETAVYHTDTIRVRARFETAGIELIFK
jgi:uncharacterized protein (DUF2141 family)